VTKRKNSLNHAAGDGTGPESARSVSRKGGIAMGIVALAIRYSLILAAGYVIVGILFWDRSLPFMLDSIIKNIPFLAIAGVVLAVLEKLGL
jgi:hypothetical protein